MEPFSVLERVVELAEGAGAEFAEARYEEMNSLLLRFERDRLDRVIRESTVGVGVTVYIKGARGYSYTTDFSDSGLKEMVGRAVKIARASGALGGIKAMPAEYSGGDYRGRKPVVRKHPSSVDVGEKIDITMSGIQEALKRPGLVSLISYYGELWGKKAFLNSEGLKREWSPIKLGILYYAVWKEGESLGKSYEEISGSRGLELFEERDPIEGARRAVEGARDNAIGKKLEPGEYKLVADPEFAGLIAHESFGHLTEGDYVVTKASILHGRLGEQLGSEHATVIDSGDPVDYGFWIPYDDEGVATETVYLVKEGRLVGYLHSRATAAVSGQKPTGNARAVSFRYPPIVRMRNTYFGPGDMTREEVFELIGKGVYAEGSMGGETNDVGVFTFAANRAYWVEGGEIKHPLKQVTVRGNVLDFLKHIIGASKEIHLRTSVLGGCGKGGQSPLPVGMGGPYLAVSKAIVSSG